MGVFCLLTKVMIEQNDGIEVFQHVLHRKIRNRCWVVGVCDSIIQLRLKLLFIITQLAFDYRGLKNSKQMYLCRPSVCVHSLRIHYYWVFRLLFSLFHYAFETVYCKDFQNQSSHL